MELREKIVAAGLVGILGFFVGCGPRRSMTVPEPEIEPLPLRPISTLMVKKSPLEKKLTWEEFQEMKIESYRDAPYFLAMMTPDSDWPPVNYFSSPKQTIDMGWRGRCINMALIGALIAEKAGYEPAVLYLFGKNNLGHVITLIEEKTDSGIKYGYIDGKDISKPILDSIDDVIVLVNYHHSVSEGDKFTQYRKTYLNGKGVDWRTYEGDLLPVLDLDWYKSRKELMRYKEDSKNDSRRLNEILKQHQKSQGRLLKQVKESRQNLDKLSERLEEIKKEIK